jgi:hypothetical protein
MRRGERLCKWLVIVVCWVVLPLLAFVASLRGALDMFLP